MLDNFLMQILCNLARCDALLDLLVTNKEDLVEIVTSNGCLDYSDHEMVEIKMLMRVGKAASNVDPGAEGSMLRYI